MNNKTGLTNWRKKTINECKAFPKYLFYLSKKQNFKSIIENGILPQNEAKDKKLKSQSFADIDVQKLRSEIYIYISNSSKKNIGNDYEKLLEARRRETQNNTIQRI